MRSIVTRVYLEIRRVKMSDWLHLAAFPLFSFGATFLMWLSGVHITNAWGHSVIQFIFGITGFVVAATIAVVCIGIGSFVWKETLDDIIWGVQYRYDENLELKSYYH